MIKMDPVNYGKRIEANPSFIIDEGSINLYYGMIRSGKTYGATADIIDLVKQGRVVYATWPIALECFDDRFDFFVSLRNFIFSNPLFLKIDCPANFHFIDAETGEVDGIPTFNADDPRAYIEYLNSLSHCVIFIDEAWRVIDSYKGTSIGEVRNLILVTGHKFREVNLIAQRPTSIHVVARGNMGRFYKFEKIATWPWVRFKRSEYQLMSGETVDELQEPVSVKTYWAKRAVYEAYNSHFYGNTEPLHKLHYEAYSLTLAERVKVMVWHASRPYRALWRVVKGRRASGRGTERSP